MKTLLAVIFAAGLIGCANANPPENNVANTHYPYDRYSTTTEVSGATSPAYAKWTTERLQKRRLDLYATVPQTQTEGRAFSEQGVPVYTVRGMPLPQQDEIKAIEVELNKRYKAGDKSAELKEAWPRNRRHP